MPRVVRHQPRGDPVRALQHSFSRVLGDPQLVEQPAQLRLSTTEVADPHVNPRDRLQCRLLEGVRALVHQQARQRQQLALHQLARRAEYVIGPARDVRARLVKPLIGLAVVDDLRHLEQPSALDQIHRGVAPESVPSLRDVLNDAGRRGVGVPDRLHPLGVDETQRVPLEPGDPGAGHRRDGFRPHLRQRGRYRIAGSRAVENRRALAERLVPGAHPGLERQRLKELVQFQRPQNPVVEQQRHGLIGIRHR